MEKSPSGMIPERILQVLRPMVVDGPSVYLIGGAVRDMLLKRPVHDLDFVMPEAVRRVARRTADALGGAFYMLDDERHTARVIVEDPQAGRLVLDFAKLRAPTLIEDLQARDFTINAIAVDVHAPQDLIDPLHGAQDVKDNCLRMCSPQAFENDPLRILRGVRLSLQFGLRIVPQTWHAMQAAASKLVQVSAERQRDELVRMAGSRGFASALRLLDQLNLLQQLFPEVEPLKYVEQEPPHPATAWEHTLSVVQNLETLLAVLVDEHQEEDVANLVLGTAVTKLGRFRRQLNEHYAREMVPDRPLRGLVKLAALLHDCGKAVARQVDEDGQVHFAGHDDQGAVLAGERAADLAFSNAEVQRIRQIVLGHMRIHFLIREPQPIARRQLYRFFRESGEAGIEICLLSLADRLAVHGPELPIEKWLAELDVVEALFSAWWEQHEQVVQPPRLVSGNDLIETLGMSPGREMGALLAAIEEAQACGELAERQQVLDFARDWMKNNR